VVGARACGFRAILVDRYKLPLEDVPYKPDRIVRDFSELADLLG
jgi:FMN phosphatase YigB (HAD superfamily)